MTPTRTEFYQGSSEISDPPSMPRKNVCNSWHTVSCVQAPPQRQEPSANAERETRATVRSVAPVSLGLCTVESEHVQEARQE